MSPAPISTELARPNPFAATFALVLDSVSSPLTKSIYKRSLRDFFTWWDAQFRPVIGRATIQTYRVHLEDSGLSSSSINVRLAAIRKFASEASYNGLIDGSAAQAIRDVKGAKRQGVRMGNWLTGRQAEELIEAPDTSTLKGKRDRAILDLLIGCGLRRSEIAALTFDHIQQRDGRWCIVDLVGKHGRVRTVTMPAGVKLRIDEWTAAADIFEGPVFRPVNKGDELAGACLRSGGAVFDCVKKYLPSVAPHDLRRTHAKLAHRAKAPLEQIQISLGHASIQTTERYLGTEQDLTRGPGDYLDLNF